MTNKSHIVDGMTDDTVPVFRALADANRRVLLDRLFERDGQTLGELCEHLPGMTRHIDDGVEPLLTPSRTCSRPGSRRP